MTFLVDTNVFVYAFRPSADPRRERAIQVLSSLIAGGSGVVSTQVLSEFARVALQKSPRVPFDVLYDVLENVDRRFRVVPVTSQIVIEAVRGATRFGMSFFDAQIWAAARLNQVPVILSEDFSHDQTIEGVLFLDPFTKGFDPSRLVA